METTATETTVTPIIAGVAAAFEVAVDVEDAEVVADEEAVEAISAEAITTVKMDMVAEEVVEVDMATTTPTATRTDLVVATGEDSVDAAEVVVEAEVDEAAVSVVATTTEVKTDSVVGVVAVEDSAHAETMMRTTKMAPMTR